MSSEDEKIARQEKLAREYTERYEANADYGGRKEAVERAKHNRRALKQAAKRLRKAS